MWIIVFMLCVVVVAVTIGLDLREERRKTRRIAELETQLAEKNGLIQQLVDMKQGE